MKKILNQYIDDREKSQMNISTAPYDWSKLDSRLSFEFAAYSQFLMEHAPELANIINELRQYILALNSWLNVLSGQSDKKRYFMINEFVSPIATVALNLPYVIRSRFIYSAAHLSHQANQVSEKEWVDDFPLEKDVYFKASDKYGKPWKEYKKLKLALEQIANKKYCMDSGNFRNSYNHRFSPRVEIGHTGFVTRIDNVDGSISYGFGSQEPLMIKDIIQLLEKQHEYCLHAFTQYQDLVNSQSIKINEVNEKYLLSNNLAI